jgi:hypothetical protein
MDVQNGYSMAYGSDIEASILTDNILHNHALNLIDDNRTDSNGE